MKRIIYIAIAALSITACGYNVDEVLLSRDDISMTIKGELIMSFDENTCQFGYNSARQEYRVYDEQFTNWYILQCSAQPTSQGQEITADIEYTKNGKTKKMKNISFKVEKISSEGVIWLWGSDEKIGIIIKQI